MKYIFDYLGLDCLTERVCTLRSSDDPSYYCELCDAEFEMRDALFHVTGTQHRFLFLVGEHVHTTNIRTTNNGSDGGVIYIIIIAQLYFELFFLYPHPHRFEGAESA